MSTYLFAYRAPSDYEPGRPEGVAAWQAWFEQLGSAVADAGNPAFDRATVENCGPDTVLGGYSLITADDLQSAIELARGCPYASEGGGVEVGELTLLNPQSLATSAQDHARATGS
jgi:hypothetical protein